MTQSIDEGLKSLNCLLPKYICVYLKSQCCSHGLNEINGVAVTLDFHRGAPGDYAIIIFNPVFQLSNAKLELFIK